MADEIAATLMEKAGAFIRQPLLWSRLGQVKTIIIDKTGTLTMERPVFANSAALGLLDDASRMALARLTAGSLHPVSRSLLEALGRDGQMMLRGATEVDVEDVPGMGRFYQDGGTEWSLGRPGWRSSDSLDLETNHDAEICRDGGRVAHWPRS